MGGKKVTRSMEIKAETSTAQEGALSGKNVSIQAGRDIALEGGLYAARQTLATINGQTQRIAVTTGKNGFIVGANPAGGVK